MTSFERRLHVCGGLPKYWTQYPSRRVRSRSESSDRDCASACRPITRPSTGATSNRYWCASEYVQSRSARAVVADDKLEFLSRAQSDNPLFARVTVPGDGVVSLESALGVPPAPTLTSMTVCSAHSAYVDDAGMTRRIAQFLLH